MKRYYRRLTTFPEGINRLESEVCRVADGSGVVTEDQIARWVDELFLDGGMKAIVGYIILRYGAWEAAMNVGRDNRFRSSFRAVWALEWAYEQAADIRVGRGGRGAREAHEQAGAERAENLPEWFFDRMVDDFTASSNDSLHRIYGKMICDRMRFGGIRPSDRQAERLAECCFDLVILPGSGVAVQIWALEILAELAPRLDWVARELPDTLRHISVAGDCSPGMRVATREILRRLGSV
jgi:hypothetical protein